MLDVAREYKQRADVTPQNGSLVLQGLRSEDTGTYRVTVKGPNGETSADVNLTVTNDTKHYSQASIPRATEIPQTHSGQRSPHLSPQRLWSQMYVNRVALEWRMAGDLE
ncbi:hypothetical protein KIL84_004088 [Mauremys mutica]|uniref:Immunoglobulin I-set domain-containing protein n=1 Tax=Mauremys mutica TaxID=74926 RepID=A0A9D4B6L7_9SAUR|nr:hypothetical protein KIL84_004088 [Mauremys mutica]